PCWIDPAVLIEAHAQRLFHEFMWFSSRGTARAAVIPLSESPRLKSPLIKERNFSIEAVAEIDGDVRHTAQGQP
ncbi:MAG: hypothetical protein ACRECZ_06130, partial [Methylocella sp.]